MTKGWRMLVDLESGRDFSHAYRRSLVERYHRANVDLPLSTEAVDFIVAKDGLEVTVLTAPYWPSTLLRSSATDSLRLPPMLSDICEDFVKFYNASTASRDINIKFELSGCSENTGLNGTYAPSHLMAFNLPVFVKTSDKDKVLVAKKHGFHLTLLADSGEDSTKCFAYCSFAGKKSSSSNFPQNLMTESWYVLKESKWIKSAMKFKSSWSEMTRSEEALPSSDSQVIDQIPTELSDTHARRLIWCHDAGTITVAVLVQSTEYFIRGSEAQISALFCFQSTKISNLSVGDVASRINMSTSDTNLILESLCHHTCPVLCAQEQNISKQFENASSKVLYHLSDVVVKHTTLDHPADLAKVMGNDHSSSEMELVTAATHLHGWRNELIDACIVRCLKNASASSSSKESVQEPLAKGTMVYSQWKKSGGSVYKGTVAAVNNDGTYTIKYDDGDSDKNVDISRISTQSPNGPFGAAKVVAAKVVASNTLRTSNAVVSSGLLCTQVKTMLSDRFHASLDDVARRAETLVCAGVIEKVGNKTNEFAPVSYSYFPTQVNETASSSPMSSVYQFSPLLDALRAADSLPQGDELFGQLASFLGMSSRLAETTISPSVFVAGIGKWLRSQGLKPTTMAMVDSSIQSISRVGGKLLGHLLSELRKLTTHQSRQMSTETNLPTKGADWLDMAAINVEHVISSDVTLISWASFFLRHLPSDVLNAVFDYFHFIATEVDDGENGIRQDLEVVNPRAASIWGRRYRIDLDLITTKVAQNIRGGLSSKSSSTIDIKPKIEV